MTAVLTLLVVVGISLLITRIATVALVSTGLSKEAARFQARSAFSGSGFTTSEAESVVNHPVRRRIIMVLMLLGNAGFVTVVSSLILTFVNVHGAFEWAPRLALLLGGLSALWFTARSRFVERLLNELIVRALRRWTDIDVGDYAGLLHLAGDYRVVQLAVDPGDWMEGHSLAELGLSEEVCWCSASSAQGTPTRARPAAAPGCWPATPSSSTAAPRPSTIWTGAPPVRRATPPTNAPSPRSKRSRTRRNRRWRKPRAEAAQG